jgi:hypothetical protein
VPEEEPRVECQSGHTYAGRPKWFVWEGQRRDVTEVLNEWRTPQARHFLVKTEDNRLFELAYDEFSNRWRTHAP